MHTLSIALNSLTKNRLRTALAVAGMSIGVGSVVLLVSIASGVRNEVVSQVESLAPDFAFILPGKLSAGSIPNPMALLGISTLTPQDVVAVANVDGVRAAFPVMFVAGSVESTGCTVSAMVIASDPQIRYLHPRQLAAGRFFGQEPASSRSAVIGDAVAKELGQPALGAAILVRGMRFRVVGVLQPEPPTLMMPGGFDRVVYVPYSAAKPIFPEGQISRVVFRVRPASNPLVTMSRVGAAVRRLHRGREDFSVLTQETMMGVMFRISTIITALLAGVAAISVTVAAIGITNIMVAVVTERSREIGIRKAFGATRRAIFLQFLAESVLIALTGGAIGMLLALGLSGAVATATPLRPQVEASTVILALATCVTVGILSGVLPAVRAARHDPVEALRYE